jgi:hypothetical protein
MEEIVKVDFAEEILPYGYIELAEELFDDDDDDDDDDGGGDSRIMTWYLLY